MAFICRQDGVDKGSCQVMVLLVWLGLFHALVAVPTLLSFLGPSTIHS